MNRMTVSLALALAVAWPLSVKAEDMYWIAPGNGLFASPDNWSSGVVPGLNDTAIFGADVAFELNFLDEQSVGRAVVKQGQMRLRLIFGPVGWSLESPSSALPAFVIGESKGDNAFVDALSSGATEGEIRATSMTLGWGAGAFGTLDLFDPDIDVEVDFEMTVGDSGNGLLSVDSGTFLGANSLHVGWGESGDGTIECHGGTIELAQDVFLGVNGSAVAVVAEGGVLQGNAFSLGVQDGSTASLTISGAGSAVACGSTFEAGVNGHAVVVIEDGGRLWVQDSVLLGMFPGEDEQLPGGEATVSVDGATSRLLVFGDLWIGMLGRAELTVSNGGQVDIHGDVITMASDSQVVIRLADDSDFIVPAILVSGAYGDVPMLVELADGFTPSIGARFRLLYAAGGFDLAVVELPPGPPGRGWLVVQSATALDVEVTASGDLDGDGFVQFSDLLLLLGEWGVCPPGACLADLNGDGLVGFGDLTILLSEWS